MEKPKIDCSKDKVRTKQSFAKAADINNIVRKYIKTGQLPIAMHGRGVYGDFTGVGELQQAIEKVQNAQEAFNMLPSNIRNRFQNDPAALVDFVNDPSNLKEARELGIVAEDATPTEPVEMPPKGDQAPQDPTPEPTT